MPLASRSVYLLAEVMASNRSPPCGQIPIDGWAVSVGNNVTGVCLTFSHARNLTDSPPSFHSCSSFLLRRLFKRESFLAARVFGLLSSWRGKLCLVETSPPLSLIFPFHFIFSFKSPFPLFSLAVFSLFLIFFHSACISPSSLPLLSSLPEWTKYNRGLK